MSKRKEGCRLEVPKAGEECESKGPRQRSEDCEVERWVTEMMGLGRSRLGRGKHEEEV